MRNGSRNSGPGTGATALSRSRRLLLLGVLASFPAAAQELKLEWVGSGAKFPSYFPRHVPLSAVRPAEVRALPAGVVKPLFGRIAVGPKEGPTAVTVMIDAPEGGEQRLFVDANANGDLTDDPPVVWTASSRAGAKPSYRGTAAARVRYGDRTVSMELAVYRLATAVRGDLAPSLFFYRQWGYQGMAALGGKSYGAMLDDEQSSGDFRGADTGKGSGVSLLLDLNGDGRFDPRGERFDVGKPFNVGGTTYEVSGLTASGAGLRIVKSGRSVAETKAAAVLKIGGAPASFEARTTDGRTLRFPGDGKARLVLLDFWATWCGPCRAELPNLKSVLQDYGPKGFEVIGISLDKADAGGRLAQFTRDNGMTWPEVHDGKEWDGEIARNYGVNGIPQGFLVDRTAGTIVAMGDGVRGANLRRGVEKVLGSAPAAPAVPSTAPPAVGSERSEPAPNTIGWARRTPSAGAQAPVPVRTAAPTSARAAVRPVSPASGPPDPLLAKAEAAMKAGTLMASGPFLEKRGAPASRPVTLLSPSTRELPGRAVARIARQAYLRAGWYYRCSKCSGWHLKLAGAYAVAGDVVVTAWHVMTPPSTDGSAFAVVVDGTDAVVPVTGVLAANERMDTVVLHVGGGHLFPVALSPSAEVGDAAFCYGDPLKEKHYFSAGIVNRFHEAGDGGGKGDGLKDPASARMNVSCDWGPGSSGAAVLDSAGNVIGHVSTVRTLFDPAARQGDLPDPGHPEERAQGAPVMTLHGAIPARSVLTLLGR